MDSESTGEVNTSLSPESREAIQNFRDAVKGGRDWGQALLEAVALWTAPNEVYNGRRYDYLIAGEAFDFLTLAQRLCQEVDGLIPQEDKDALILSGRLPSHIDEQTFRELMGAEKYSGYLNYFYGITVEEALLLAMKEAIRKERFSKGHQQGKDYSEQAYQQLYDLPREDLLRTFRREKGYPHRRSILFGELKEFTYWLFKYRLEASDQARAASDTVKGLKQLQRMGHTHIDGRFRLF